MKVYASFIYLSLRTKFSKLLNRLNCYKKYKLFIHESVIIKNIQNISIGKNFQISPNCSLFAEGANNEKIIIKNNVALNYNVMINANNKGNIQIGNDVIIGPNVVLRASNHIYNDISKSIRYQSHDGGKINIEDDVWIGSNVIILPNINIGKGSIIGAGSVVTKNIPEYSVAVGVPARVIKNRK